LKQGFQHRPYNHPDELQGKYGLEGSGRSTTKKEGFLGGFSAAEPVFSRIFFCSVQNSARLHAALRFFVTIKSHFPQNGCVFCLIYIQKPRAIPDLPT
jgi:hypothetical protein